MTFTPFFKLLAFGVALFAVLAVVVGRVHPDDFREAEELTAEADRLDRVSGSIRAREEFAAGGRRRPAAPRVPVAVRPRRRGDAGPRRAGRRAGAGRAGPPAAVARPGPVGGRLTR